MCFTVSSLLLLEGMFVESKEEKEAAKKAASEERSDKIGGCFEGVCFDFSLIPELLPWIRD